MILINNINEQTFSLNGINYTKNFVAIKTGEESLMIANLYDTRFQLLASTKYNEIIVNGAVFANLTLLMNALTSILFFKKNVQDVPYLGSIIPTSPAYTGSTGFWTATQAGTYTNYGSVVVSGNSFATISKASGVFSISQTPLDLSGQLSKTTDKGIYGDANKWIDGAQIKTGVVAERININKDVLFDSFPTGSNNNWRDLASGGSTYTKSNGAITITSFGTDSNISYNASSGTSATTFVGDTLLVTGNITIPTGTTFTTYPSIGLVIITNLSTYTMTPGVATVIGENKISYQVKLDSSTIGASTIITNIRIDCRGYKSGVTFSNVGVVNKKNIEYIKPYVNELIDTKFTPSYANYMSKFSSTDTNDDFNFITTNVVPSGVIVKTINGDGSIKLAGELASGATSTYLYSNFVKTTSWLANHHYYVALKVNVNRIDGATDGNFVPSIIPKRSPAESLGSSTIKQTVLSGETGIMKADLVTNSSLSILDGKNLYLQFKHPISTAGQGVDIDFIDVAIYDLGEVGSETLTYNQFDDLFNANEFQSIYSQIEIDGLVTNGSGTGTTPTTLANIQVTGDSLAAQNWWNQISGRTVTALAFGGKKSSYIRDQFLANLDATSKAKTHIFYLGRNNYGVTDTVIRDLKIMINAIEHQRYLILMPPNGGYGDFLAGNGELKNGTSYPRFAELSRRLQNAFPSNFIDSRKAMIDRYEFGNVRLLSGFTQPAINSNVQISVSSTSFLTTENATDKTNNPTVAGKIIIGSGLTSGYDIYEVVSVDSSTLMTVKLLTNGSSIAPAGTVDNGNDEGSIIHLQVLQYLDLLTWQMDTLISTSRSDGIHSSTTGLSLLSKIVSEALIVKGI